VLTSPDLVGRIIAADTHPEVEGSDHCPVSLVLDL
jgi:exonuclease III